MLGLRKTFYVMWATDDGHSPPTEMIGSSATAVASKFMQAWPGFDGQLWIFPCKPEWPIAPHRRGVVFAKIKAGAMRLNRAARRR